MCARAHTRERVNIPVTGLRHRTNHKSPRARSLPRATKGDSKKNRVVWWKEKTNRYKSLHFSFLTIILHIVNFQLFKQKESGKFLFSQKALSWKGTSNSPRSGWGKLPLAVACSHILCHNSKQSYQQRHSSWGVQQIWKDKTQQALPSTLNSIPNAHRPSVTSSH